MDTEIRELRHDLETYRPGNGADCLYYQGGVQFPDHLVIGLFGRSRCGKTALVNSMKFAVSERIREGELPIATSEDTGGQTLMRVIAKLVENIFVVENRGLDDLTNEVTLTEMEAQIDGKRGYAKQVVWKNREGDVDMYGIPDVETKKDPIGCVVFVFSARDSIRENIDGLYQLVSFLHTKQDRYPLAVITNVECVDRDIVDKLRSTLQVSGISEVFEVENITEGNTTLQNSCQHSLLSLLDRCMTDGDAAVVFKQNQEREQTEKRESEEKRRSEKKTQKEMEKRKEQSYCQNQQLSSNNSTDLQDNRAKVGIKIATTTGDTVRLPVGGPDVPAAVADKTTSVLAAIAGGVTLGLVVVSVAAVAAPVGAIVVAGVGAAGVGAAGLVAAAGKVPTSAKKICARLNPQSNTPAEHREADQQ